MEGEFLSPFLHSRALPEFDLIATAGFGLEAILRRELTDLGYESQVVAPGRLLFRGDDSAIREANLSLRTAERVLVRMAYAPATDFDQLFELVQSAAWSEWITPDGALPVRGRSHRSELSSVPACQRTVKKALVEALREQHGVAELPETGPEYPIEVALLDDEATLLLDTTGTGLHKRGYRRYVGAAPLRETLAAAMVLLSRWTPERPFWDPFCGSGTLAIEAAMIGRKIAPGLRREFLCESWPRLAGEAWRTSRESAEAHIGEKLPERLLATDESEEELKLARRHAEAAGVAEDIHFQRRDFKDISSKRDYGCLITNPPYGERIGEREEIEALYRSMPDVLRRLKTWSHFILTARGDFEKLVGQQASKRRKLYNGRLECTLYQFFGERGAKKEKPKAESQEPTAPQQAFGGLKQEAERQALEFANRLKNRARHLRKWPTKRGITCFRLYDRDVPEVPLVIDRYEDTLHIAEYERPHDRTPAEHADWLDLMIRTAAEALDTSREAVFVKRRERQRGETQYEKFASAHQLKTVTEGGLKFRVNLSDYLDTGLFLDHRITRGMVRDAAEGKRFLNLFGYTGSFTVYAAAGGAVETSTVDLSQTYLDWAADNLRLNGLSESPQHQLIRDDSAAYIDSLPEESLFDLAVVDPPTYSNSKRLEEDWDVQRDAVPLLNAIAKRMSPGGLVYFSTNFRRFRFEESELVGYTLREISRQTVPEDFRNKRIHRCWRLVRR